MRLLPDETAFPYEPSPAMPPDVRITIDRYLSYLERILSNFEVHQTCPACQDRIRPTDERLLKLQTMPYKKYLRTREWQDARRGALCRANYQCQRCGSRAKTLHVHHNTYKRRGHEWPTDLVVLCDDCHKEHHGR